MDRQRARGQSGGRGAGYHGEPGRGNYINWSCCSAAFTAPFRRMNHAVRYTGDPPLRVVEPSATYRTRPFPTQLPVVTSCSLFLLFSISWVHRCNDVFEGFQFSWLTFIVGASSLSDLAPYNIGKGCGSALGAMGLYWGTP